MTHVSRATWDHHLAWLWAQVAQGALLNVIGAINNMTDIPTLHEIVLH